jgi:hypothetical protein
MAYQNECVLRDQECVDCGECDICDLDETKTCDNCCKCIDSDADYRGIYIDDIMDNDTAEEDIENTVFDEDVTEEIE